MSQPGGGSLGALFVDVRPATSRFGPELSKDVTTAGNRAADAAGPGMGKRLAGHIGKALAIGAGVLAVGLTKGLAGAVKNASDLNETMSKANVVFGKSGKEIQKWSQTTAKSMGLSRKAALDGATTFAIYGKAAGKSGKDLVGFSTGLSGLASDMASFSNTSPEEAIEAIGAAMRGESDPIEKYGVLLNETVLKNRALKLGIIETTKQALTPQQRVLAVQAELFAQLGDKGSKAMGDFARTSGGLANQQRIAKAEVTNLSATIGRSLLPIAVKLTTTFNTTVIPMLRELWRDHGPAVVAWLTTAADRFGKWASSIDSADVASWLAKAKSAFASAQPVITKFFDNFQSGGKEGLSDTIKVTGVAMGFLADHADLLGKALPYVAAGLVAYKVAQLAANIAQAVAPITTAALAASNFRLAASNTALAATTASATTATVAGTGAQTVGNVATNVGTLARVRHAAATVAVTAATKLWSAATIIGTGVMKAFRLVMATAFGPISIIIAVVALLAAGIVWLYKNNATARKVIDTAWKWIKIAVKAVGDWFVGTLWPSLKKAFQQLMVVVRVLVTVWRFQFNLMRTILSTVWNGIKGTFEKVANFVTKTLPNAFKKGVENIRTLWAKVKEAAAAPVRFVIDTVFNKIGGTFNKVADFLKLPAGLRVPTVSAGFASGGHYSGRLPGRPSDVDNMVAAGPGGRAIALASGEFIVNARQTSKHLPMLQAINNGMEGFAGGGLLDYLMGPAGWARAQVSGTVDKIASKFGDGQLAKALTGLAGKLADGLVTRVSDPFGLGGKIVAYGRSLRGLTPQMMAAVTTILGGNPGVRMVSGLRPGAITVTGNRSYHGYGRAADFAPPSMRLFNFARALFGRIAKELIYSPAGNRQVHNGSPHMYTGRVRATHWDHVHLALAGGGRVFDRGGVWPSGTVGVNTSGRNEVVATAATMDDVLAEARVQTAILAKLAQDIGRQMGMSMRNADALIGRRADIHARAA